MPLRHRGVMVAISFGSRERNPKWALVVALYIIQNPAGTKSTAEGLGEETYEGSGLRDQLQ